MTVAEATEMEVVNADPFQAWSGMAVLTAQPGPELLARIRHHLVGVHPPDRDRDAAGFAEEVSAICADVRGRDRTPLVVSGSGLYLRALAGGLDDGLPAPDPALRAELDAQDLARLLEMLQSLDPVELQRIDRRNKRRVVRAVEICQLAGQPVSQLRRQRDAPPELPPQGVWLDLPAEALRARIRARADAMMGEALADEIKALAGRGLCRAASRTLGLKIARDWVASRLSRAEAVDQLTTATWQLARRQRTWFRRAPELEPLRVEQGDSPNRIATRVQAWWEQHR